MDIVPPRNDAYHRYGGTECTNAETTDQSTDSELRPGVLGSNLNDDTDDEDATFDGHSPPTTKPVCCSEDPCQYWAKGVTREKKVLTLLPKAHQ